MKINKPLFVPEGGDGTGDGKTATPPAAAAAGTFTQEQLNAAVEKARTEEKQKLYGEIETLKGKVKTAEEATVARDTTILGLTAKVQAFEASKTADGSAVDITKLVTEVSERTRKVVEAEYEPKLNEVRTTAETTSRELRTLTLSQYRANKVAEAGGEDKLVMALVTGSTEAEVDASITRAAAEYTRIATKVAPGTPPAKTPPVVPPAIPAGGGSGGLPKAGIETVASMSIRDYGVNREDLKRQSAVRYAGQG